MNYEYATILYPIIRAHQALKLTLHKELPLSFLNPLSKGERN